MERRRVYVHDIRPHHLKTLLNNDLFKGIHIRKIPEVLAYLNARVEEYEKGELIIRLGEQVEAGVILRGQARVAYYDVNMNPMAVDHLLEGMTFGQHAACALGYASQIELVASAYTQVLRLDFEPIVRPSTDGKLPEHHHIVAANVLRSVADHATHMHQRLRVIGQKTVRSRLKVYLEYLTGGGHDWAHIPFSMSDLAVHLNSDRSALYKEINALKEEGFLEWHRRRVRVHNHDF